MRAMSDATTPPLHRSTAWTIALTALLGLAAALYTGYHLLIALGADDTNHLETPLALAVSRQVTEGPGVLYGPFNGQRPLVLIHAPLYYRLAALGAWPLWLAGLDPYRAALAGGRILSLLGFLGSLGVMARLATLDEASRRAGVWSALLVASAAVFGSFPVTVRPDTLAVCFQTLGAWLVLRAIRDGRSRDAIGAYVALGLAVCAKQHCVAVAAVSSLFLAGAWRRGRIGGRAVVLAHAAGLVVVAAYYGFEQWLTGGMMARSVFVLPAAFREIAPADWSHVAETFFEVAKRSIGLIALAGAALPLVRRTQSTPLDAALLAYLGAEVALTALLCRGSTGAWVNYAMQAVVFAAILTGRGLARGASRPAVPGWWRVAVVAGALVLLAADARLVAISARHRSAEKAALRALLADPRIRFESPDGLYFVGYPQHNRTYGRAELAHDEWLYQAYEALGAAEPRDRWLARALNDGPVRVVVVPLDGRKTLREVPGLSRSLPELGYRPLAAFGRYRAWARQDEALRVAASRPAP
jgi:hypothetical protein